MSDVFTLLRQRFAAPAWGLLEEVANGTGYVRRNVRRADMVAMSLWPSRGLELHGIEVKVARGDWLKELKEPAKADEIARFMDRWWLAVSSDDIVKQGELPLTWGLMIVEKGRLVVKSEAPKLDAERLDRPMLAALFRSMSSQLERSIPRSQIAQRIEDAARQERERTESLCESRLKRMESDLNRMREVCRAFEKHSGVRLNEWIPQPESIGDAVKMVLDGGTDGLRADLEDLLRRARLVVEHAEGALRGMVPSTGAGHVKRRHKERS